MFEQSNLLFSARKELLMYSSQVPEEPSLIMTILGHLPMVALVMLGIFLLSQIFFIVRQQHEFVIERLGKFNRIAGAGLNIKIPFLEQVAYRASLQVDQINIDVEAKTKDNVFVKLKIAVQRTVVRGRSSDAFYKLSNDRSQITAYVLDVVRAKVPTLDLDDTFAKKDEIADEVKQTLASKLGEFGFEIHDVLVMDIDPDAGVKQAMNEIQTQQRLQIAAKAQAEADKIVLVKKAEAEAEAKKLQGEGIANERKAIAQGILDSIKMFEEVPGFNAEHVSNTLLLTQHYDTMKAVGTSDNTKVLFMPTSPSGVQDLADQVRNAVLTGNEASTSTTTVGEGKSPNLKAA